MDSKIFETEMNVLAAALNDQRAALPELSDLQLALVGGGIGDVQHG